MSRRISIELNEVLDLVAAAVDYGYDEDVLMHTFYKFCEPVTEEEIIKFSELISVADGYSEEDGEEVGRRLTAWVSKYSVVSE